MEEETDFTGPRGLQRLVKERRRNGTYNRWFSYFTTILLMLFAVPHYYTGILLPFTVDVYFGSCFGLSTMNSDSETTANTISNTKKPDIDGTSSKKNERNKVDLCICAILFT